MGQNRAKLSHGNVNASSLSETVSHGNVNLSPKILIVEDVRSAETILKAHNYECERVTHNEAHSWSHEITRKISDKAYSMMWISTPADWHCRHRKATAKMSTLAKWNEARSSSTRNFAHCLWSTRIFPENPGDR